MAFLKSIVSVVFALTLLVVCCSGAANPSIHQLNFDNIPIGGYQSLLLFPTGTFNLRGPVVFTVSSQYSCEICITKFVALSSTYTSCPAGMSQTFPGLTTSTVNFESDTIFSDSYGMKDESYGEKVGMTDFVGGTNPGSLTVYLTAGTIYYVNLHLTATNLNGQNATQATVYAQYNPNNCQDTKECPNCIGNPDNTCVSYTPVPSTGQNTFHLPFNQTYFLGVNIPLSATNFAVNLQSSYSKSFDIDANQIFPIVCVRQGSSPNCMMKVFDLNLGANANWTQQSGANNYTAGFNLTSPTPGMWFIEFYNNVTGNAFQITYTGSVKSCANGTLGSNCSQLPTLMSSPNVTGPINTGFDYDYYMVINSTLSVGVGTKNLKINAPTLLTDTRNFPSNTSYLLLDNNKTVNYIHSYLPFANTTWYISVATNPLTPYYLWANEPCAYNCIAPGKNNAPGTTAHGNCTASNGTCSCNKHYGGLWCYHTGLATVWIVLIVIGCAILLAIAIGVPVALYLRSRQRARYERV
jgi:hypothetical protein